MDYEARRQRLLELLAPGGKVIGDPARKDGRVRRVVGGVEEARALYEELARLGNDMPVENPSIGSRPGLRVEISGLGYIGYREVSDSGEPTVDCRVNLEELKQLKKIKFVGRAG